MKKTRKVLAAVVAIALLVPMFAAFEAHTINVKAHIENALQVSMKEVDFGTVFPQEVFDREFSVGLSESFMAQDRVNDVHYKLTQLRKPKTTSEKLDVVFAFDLTGSMRWSIDGAKAEAAQIIEDLKLVSPDLSIGVMSCVDYPGFYDSYGYATYYGNAGWGDYAYNLDAALSADTDAVVTAMNGLTTKDGADYPQDYARLMYEAVNDSNIGWRDDAQKIVIMFGDNVPHDDDINAGVPGKSGVLSTGGDPGRDEIMFTVDDIDLQDALAAMAGAGIKLYSINPNYGEYWSHWTGITGGSAVSPDDFAGVADSIVGLLFYDDLRPFLTKTSLEEEGDLETAAVLDKSVGDTSDAWNVHFYVPCIVGAVGRDYVGPIAEREADYGADIWVEVYGLSYADGTAWPADL